MTEENRDGGGFGAGMMLGIIVGAAAVLFFQSEQGEKTLNKLKSKAEDAVKDLENNDLVKEKIEEAQRAVLAAKETIESAKAKLTDLNVSSAKESKLEKKRPRFFTRSS